ncbi:MAG: hypothetical protein CFK52_13460 [Chloracidobacterium sp. CP2_5A]|nr:MAG: hypothetical protein CFK52_13460 [Chloracidobacterium sp. CP2_5A]
MIGAVAATKPEARATLIADVALWGFGRKGRGFFAARRFVPGSPWRGALALAAGGATEAWLPNRRAFSMIDAGGAPSLAWQASGALAF